MFDWNNKKNVAGLDDAIERLLIDMNVYPTESDEYAILVGHLTTLNDLKAKAKWKFSGDGMLAAGANLLGILLIISHEQTNVLTSKALSFVMKPK